MEFFSQVGQDRFLFDNYFRGKRQGVFLDVGAYDGEKFSNSLFFERNMGWTGLCIEPLPSAFAKLRRSRTAQCENVCVSNFEGEADFVECDAGIDEKMLSGLSGAFDPRHVERVAAQATSSAIRKMPVTTLNALLEKHGLFHIDYCSIDIEGAEMCVLEGLDLERFHIDLFTIENNYNEPRIAEFMAARGYDLVTRLSHDDVYARRGVQRPARTSVICAVWHGDKDRHALLRGHMENLARQSVPITPIYVFDGGDPPPDWLEGEILASRASLTIYQAWNIALARVTTSFVMNLNLDDRLAPDAVETLEKFLQQQNAALVGGDWNICYSQDETDAVRPSYPAGERPLVESWPPAPGKPARLGSGTGENRSMGPATLWRMDAHIGMPRYPWRFGDGSPIRVVGDAAWWQTMATHLQKKIVRLPMVIGNYHSHPGSQAEFRTNPESEQEMLSRLGVSRL